MTKTSQQDAAGHPENPGKLNPGFHFAASGLRERLQFLFHAR